MREEREAEREGESEEEGGGRRRWERATERAAPSSVGWEVR